MDSKKAVVLDFDGTIADAEPVLLKIYEPLAAKNGWPKLTRKDYYRLKKGGPREVMRWADVKLWQIPKLLRLGRTEYKKHAHEVRLFPGISEVLSRLAQKADVFILSSNDPETVRIILKANGIKTPINILRGSSLFGKGKVLKKLLRNHGYNPGDSWMVGDEIRDVQAGRSAGMNTLGVTWGLQSEAGIRKSSPDSIARKPDDILKFIYNKS